MVSQFMLLAYVSIRIANRSVGSRVDVGIPCSASVVKAQL